MFRFAHWLTDTHGVDIGPLIVDDGNIAAGLYRRLHAWSITELPAFWDAVREYFGVLGDGFDTDSLTASTMPAAIWYPNAHVNFTENVLERPRKQVEDYATALVNIDEDNVIDTVNWRQLRTRVHGLAEQLRDLGVQPGAGSRPCYQIMSRPSSGCWPAQQSVWSGPSTRQILP